MHIKNSYIHGDAVHRRCLINCLMASRKDDCAVPFNEVSGVGEEVGTYWNYFIYNIGTLGTASMQASSMCVAFNY